MFANRNSMLSHDKLLAPGEVMAGLDATGLLVLLEQLLDHPLGDAKALGYLFLGAFTMVTGVDDTLTQIEGSVAMPANNTISNMFYDII